MREAHRKGVGNPKIHKLYYQSMDKQEFTLAALHHCLWSKNLYQYTPCPYKSPHNWAHVIWSCFCSSSYTHPTASTPGNIWNLEQAWPASCLFPFTIVPLITFWGYQEKKKKNFLEGRHTQYNNPSVQFSHSVVSDSLRPHELQHTRPPCPKSNALLILLPL